MRQTTKPPAAHIRIAMALLILATISTSSGCIATEAIKDYCRYNDNSNDFVMGWRNAVWARQAWHAQKAEFAGHPQFHAFGEGFRDGYVSVASGGNGCPPAMPPRKFWSWRYQNPEGQAQIAAWWEGFPYGAKAAEEDGAGLYQQIQVSHPIQVQYSDEFLHPELMQQPPLDPAGRPAPTPPPGQPLEQVYPPSLPPGPNPPQLQPPTGEAFGNNFPSGFPASSMGAPTPNGLSAGPPANNTFAANIPGNNLPGFNVQNGAVPGAGLGVSANPFPGPADSRVPAPASAAVGPIIGSGLFPSPGPLPPHLPAAAQPPLAPVVPAAYAQPVGSQWPLPGSRESQPLPPRVN
jgi:hypothetical protein